MACRTFRGSSFDSSWIIEFLCNQISLKPLRKYAVATKPLRVYIDWGDNQVSNRPERLWVGCWMMAG